MVETIGNFFAATVVSIIETAIQYEPAFWGPYIGAAVGAVVLLAFAMATVYVGGEASTDEGAVAGTFVVLLFLACLTAIGTIVTLQASLFAAVALVIAIILFTAVVCTAVVITVNGIARAVSRRRLATQASQTTE